MLSSFKSGLRIAENYIGLTSGRNNFITMLEKGTEVHISFSYNAVSMR